MFWLRLWAHLVKKERVDGLARLTFLVSPPAAGNYIGKHLPGALCSAAVASLFPPCCLAASD